MPARVYRRRRIGAVIILLLLVFSVFAAYFLLPVGGRVVLLGSDARTPEGSAEGSAEAVASRSDTILVAKAGKGALSVPRDTLVEIPGYGEDKINAAFAYGGAELTVETLEDLTGLPIGNYVIVDFDGVKDIVDALGGVTLKVEEPISVGLDGQKVEIPAGTQTLDGLQALAYVRYRGGPTADIGRIGHQQKFLSALVREATSVSKIPRWPATIRAISDNTETNMSTLEVTRFAIRTWVLSGLLGGSAEVEIYPGTPQYIEGVAYWVPDEETAASLIEETIE